MFLKKNLVLASLCLSAFVGGLQAQTRTIFVLPTNGSGVQSYSSDPFGATANFSAAPAPFLVLANTTGTKYYVISKSPTNTVVVVDGTNFSTLVTGKFNFGQNAEAAVVTPDGKRLIVLAGSVHIIDLATDTDLTPNGIGLNVIPNDVAVSLDSTRAYFLSRGSASVVSFDLTTNTLTGQTFAPSGINTTISVAPNGYVYVTAQNRVYELDPKTLAPHGTEISLNAIPGQPVFTPDGKYALFANKDPRTGSVLILLDLAQHKVASFLSSAANINFDQIFITGPNTAYGVSVGTGKIYNLAIPDLNGSTETNFPSANFGNLLAAAVSKEINPRTLYLASANVLYRVDLSPGGNLAIQQTGLSGVPLSLNFAGPSTTGTAAQVLLYNNNQSVAAGTAFVPLIVRVVDNAGRPLANAPVTFSSADAGTVVQTTNVLTSNDGYAQTLVTASQTAGTYNLSATSGTAVGTFALAVTGTGTGPAPGTGMGPGNSGNSIFSIIGGNGQLIREQFQAQDLLAVVVRDAAGKPVQGATVTYSVTSGSGLAVGSLQGVSGTQSTLGTCTPSDQTAVCITDANGQAGIGFRGISANNQSFASATVTATTGNASVNFIETIYLSSIPGVGFQPDPTIVDVTPASGADRTFTVQAGQTLPAAIQVRVLSTSGTSQGFGIPNVGVNATTGLDPNLGPTASCNVATNLSDASGLASCDLVAGGKVGSAPLSISVGSVNNRATGTLVVTPGLPALINILQGNNQTGVAGQQVPLALVAQVTDAFGNILKGQQVTFEVVNPGTVTLKNVFSTSDQNGKVSALATLGGTPGAQQVRVKLGNIVSTFTLSVNVTFGGITAVSGAGQTVAINQPFSQPLVVRVTDTNGAAIPNASVAFAVNGGTATLSAASATTDAAGNASVNVTAGANAGPITVNATIGNFATTFNLTSRLPGPSLSIAGFKNGASFIQGVVPGGIVSIQGSGIAPTVQGVVSSGIVGQLPTSLAGVDVTFNGFQAPIYSVSNVNGTEQVNVQVPFDLPPGQATVTVRVNGGSTTINNVPVLALNPGIFETTDSTGRRLAVATKDVDGSFVSPANPARRGDVIRVYLTGLGQVTPNTGTNRVGLLGQRVLAPIIVGLNNAGIPLGTAEYMPGAIGVYTITFTIPDSAPSGNAIPVSFGLTGADGNQNYSNTSNIAIQ